MISKIGLSAFVLLCLVASVSLFFIVFCVYSCASQKDYTCTDSIEYINHMACEDATMLGYVSAYIGQDEWKKLVDSYQKDVEKSRYGNGCGKYWGSLVRKKNI